MNWHLSGEDAMAATGIGVTGKTSWRPRWLSVAIMAAALVLAGGMFTLSRNVTQRDEQRLTVFEADNAKTAVTALISQIESTMSSVGSVAAATNGDPAAVNRLAAADPNVAIFSALAILHQSPNGALVVTSQRGTPSASLPGLVGVKGRDLANVGAHGGVAIMGFYGHGSGRRLAMAAGAPAIPGGYVVYVEVPLPAGTTFQSGVAGLQYALYDGRSE
jgi:hypothetical protein